MKRWYYTFFVNHNRISVYEYADYGGVGGYETEAEAKKAANSFIDSEISDTHKALNKYLDYAKSEANKLEKILKAKEELNEIS